MTVYCDGKINPVIKHQLVLMANSQGQAVKFIEHSNFNQRSVERLARRNAREKR
jgi:hypothetical protein